MKLTEYFKNRQNVDAPCESMVGNENVKSLSVIHRNYLSAIEDAETAIMVEVCESCEFSSSEIKIFKTGLMAMRELMRHCDEEVQIEEEEIKNKEEIKKVVKNPTY